MNSRLLIVVVGLVALFVADLACANAKITPESIVKKHGYPFEVHTIQTEDGYLLEVHRIPNSPSNKESFNRPIALMGHGLSGSSIDYLLLDPSEGLSYLLVDAGYDVWLINFRGNTYSRKHIKYNPNVLVGKFWDFTWHEMGTKDLTATIDYIRNATGQNEFRYFGHSQGTTAFLVMSSLNATYQQYFKSAHLMSPLVYVEDLSEAFLEVASKAIALINPLPTLAGNTEFRPNGTITKLAGAALCKDKPRELCSDILFILVGFNEVTVKPSIISDVLATTPAGASTKCFLHYFQLHDSNEFQQYDYGLVGNLIAYKSRKPPTYPLDTIKVPMAFYYSEKDRLIHKQDINRIADQVPNVIRVYEIPNATFTSPIYAAGIKEQLYNLIFEDVASIE